MAAFTISIAAARTNARMTQAEWAAALGVTVDTVVSWEKGKTEPKWSHIREMSRLSGIPMDYIFVPEQS